MFDRASSFSALVGMAVDVVSSFMALLSSVESAPRAYRLKASNAASPISTSIGTIPVLLVGSVPCHTADETFRTVAPILGDLAIGLSDGEIDARRYWVMYIALNTWSKHP
ncbi:MAG: hypothetical protein ACREEP_01440, partial [Dongiaceae bacterium]